MFGNGIIASAWSIKTDRLTDLLDLDLGRRGIILAREINCCKTLVYI